MLADLFAGVGYDIRSFVDGDQPDVKGMWDTGCRPGSKRHDPPYGQHPDQGRRDLGKPSCMTGGIDHGIATKYRWNCFVVKSREPVRKHEYQRVGVERAACLQTPIDFWQTLALQQRIRLGEMPASEKAAVGRKGGRVRSCQHAMLVAVNERLFVLRILAPKEEDKA